jgi:2-haloacid dehalogenase
MSSPSPIFIFDAFGTLFDVHAVVREHSATLGSSAVRLSRTWRAKQLEYTWIYARIDRSRGFVMLPFREITRASLMYALEVCQLDAGLATALLGSYQRLPAFPEVHDALLQLKRDGAHLAILSNADTDMLDDLVGNAGFNGVFDHLISASAAGSVKPDPCVYALGPQVFGRAARDLTFVSSNRWDVAGASASGYQTVWVNRTGAPDEYPELAADAVITNLTELVV